MKALNSARVLQLATIPELAYGDSDFAFQPIEITNGNLLMTKGWLGTMAGFSVETIAPICRVRNVYAWNVTPTRAPDPIIVTAKGMILDEYYEAWRKLAVYGGKPLDCRADMLKAIKVTLKRAINIWTADEAGFFVYCCLEFLNSKMPSARDVHFYQV